jgi:uncharacterized protein YecT (DUF1311 family)
MKIHRSTIQTQWRCLSWNRTLVGMAFLSFGCLAMGALPTKAQSAPTCAEAKTQLEINQCKGKEFAQADAQLNRIYRQQLKRLSRPDRDRLITAELAWIEFRDAECQFRADKYKGGSIWPTIYSHCKTQLSQARTAELQHPHSIDEDYEASDRYLNRSYQSVQQNTSPQQQEQLIDAQLAWLEYRDRNCDFEGSSPSTAPLSRDQCLARMSRHRATDLLQEGADES